METGRILFCKSPGALRTITTLAAWCRGMWAQHVCGIDKSREEMVGTNNVHRYYISFLLSSSKKVHSGLVTDPLWEFGMLSILWFWEQAKLFDIIKGLTTLLSDFRILGWDTLTTYPTALILLYVAFLPYSYIISQLAEDFSGFFFKFLLIWEREAGRETHPSLHALIGDQTPVDATTNRATPAGPSQL